MKKNVSVNDVQTELTFEKLKTYKDFENITESEAEKQIKIIKGFAKVLQFLYIHELQNEKINNYESDSEQFGT